jgi:hypothetical protein
LQEFKSLSVTYLGELPKEHLKIYEMKEDPTRVARRCSRRVHVVKFFLAFAILTPMMFASGQIVAGAAPKKSPLITPASPCTSNQIRPSISATIESDSSSSIVVLLQTSLVNISKKSCSIEIGPTSPSLKVDNPDGTLAWNNCFAGDQPGACPLFLELKTLKPKGTYSWSTTWPPTPSSTVLPTPGTYTFTAFYDGIAASLSTIFVLAN